MNSYYKIFMAIACVLSVFTLNAQERYSNVMKLIAERNNFKDVSYDYSMKLIRGKVSVEEVNGTYSRTGASYKDSNERYIQFLQDQIFYKIDHINKFAVVYNTKLFVDKMKFTDQKSEFIMNTVIDSAYQYVQRSGIDTTSKSKAVLTYFLKPEHQYEWIKFTYDKRTFKLSSLAFAIKQDKEEVSKHSYVLYEIKNMNFGMAKLSLDLRKFFLRNGNDVKLNPLIKGYKLSVTMK